MREIGDIIARDDPAAARRFVARLRQRCLSLAAHRFRGRAVPGIAPDVRVTVPGRHLILYRVLDDAVAIDRVVHEARDLATGPQED